MPIYCFVCPKCGIKEEIVHSMKDAAKPEQCSVCRTEMRRDFQAEHHNVGNKEYAKTQYSDALAVAPSQIEEHKRQFPDVKIDAEGRPGFDNYQQHHKYLEKIGAYKQPQQIRKIKRKVR